MSRASLKAAAEGARVVAFPMEPFDDGRLMAINERFALVLTGSKALILKENGPQAPVSERVQMMSLDAFKAWFTNHRVRVEDKWKTYGDLWLADPRRRQYEGVEFAPGPELAPAQSLRPGWYNLWQGFDVEPDPSGDCGPFIDHLFDNVAAGDNDNYEWLMAFFGSLVQVPRERPGVACVLRGPTGAGKTIVGETIGSLISSHYLPVDDPRYLTGQFNAHLSSCLLLQADEAYWAGDRNAEGRLKGLVTSAHHMIEHKGLDPIRVANYVRLIITSEADWVVPASLRERRFAVFDVSGARAQDHDYFGRLVDAMAAPGGRAALLHKLLNFPLSALNLRELPKTGGLLEQKRRSADTVTLWWWEVLAAGELEAGQGGWPEWQPTTWLFETYQKFCEGRRRRGVSKVHFGRRLLEICPEAARARQKSIVSFETGKLEEGRAWGYSLPPLIRARELFEAVIDQPVDWEGGG